MYDADVKVKKKKKSKGKKLLRALCIFLVVIVLIGIATTIANAVVYKSEDNFAKGYDPVQYTTRLEPIKDENGFTTFVTDGDFKILQITDVHIGAGYLSSKKDQNAINAVAAMVTAEKPDLVCVTGDISYPVPFQSGTINNKTSATIFADLMEQLGVYWAPVFGNHDTEAYSYCTREDIAEIYSSDKYPHCLFETGDPAVHGVGNYVINIKDSAGNITESIFMIDSNDYVDKSLKSTIVWDYDCIHKDQVDWYRATLKTLTAANGGVRPKSLAFFHIPTNEVKDAWVEYCENDFQDTADVQYIYGKAGEEKGVICCSDKNEGFFTAVLEEGSTQGIFNGHDHLNNFSLYYKGIRITYGMSVDYLAYFGIGKIGSQRGCTPIIIHPDGSFDCSNQNYYQDKYQNTFNAHELDHVELQEEENHIPTK